LRQGHDVVVDSRTKQGNAWLEITAKKVCFIDHFYNANEIRGFPGHTF
jgi:hypothetical protein